MPVSGRPTKAALLKMTQGSSAAEVKGLQKAASGLAALETPGAAIAGSGSFRFHSRLPKTINEVIKPASTNMNAIRHPAGTVAAVTVAGDTSRGGTLCGRGSIALVSKIR